MTSARRTPIYVAAIGSAPMGPHLLEEETPAPPALTPAHGRRASGTAVLPFHTTAAPLAPVHPVAEPATLAPAAGTTLRPARARRKVVPVSHRPWNVLIVSTAPGAAPRSFQVARWQARAVIGALALGGLLATAFVAAVVVTVRDPDLLMVDGGELAAVRSELAAARDSLASARAELDASEPGSGDSVDVAPPEAATPTAAAPAKPAAKAAATPKAEAAHPRPLSARAAHRLGADEGSVLANMPRSLADLPVIGMIASGFSRARRHPLLHITRPHLGVDVAAPRGTRVSAPAPGRVQFVGRKLGFGLVVELDHGNGITTRYAHLRSSAVEVGEQVTKGEAIAAVGTSGITTGPHLHYEVLVHGHQVDPLRFRFAGTAPEPAAVSSAPVTPAVPAAAGVSSPAPAGSAVGTHDSPGPLAPAP